MQRKLARLVLVALILQSALFLTGSQHVHLAPINVSKPEYRAALAKWNNLHVTRYAATLQNEYECRVRIVVSVDQTSPEHEETVMETESLGSARPDDPDRCKRITRPEYHTVAQLFYSVNYVLENPAEAATNPYHGFAESYTAQFDPVMGYPRQFVWLGGLISPLTVTIEHMEVLYPWSLTCHRWYNDQHERTIQ
jgi:hypothetical protein